MTSWFSLSHEWRLQHPSYDLAGQTHPIPLTSLRSERFTTASLLSNLKTATIPIHIPLRAYNIQKKTELILVPSCGYHGTLWWNRPAGSLPSTSNMATIKANRFSLASKRRERRSKRILGAVGHWLRKQKKKEKIYIHLNDTITRRGNRPRTACSRWCGHQ